jgi:hypothetical protein
MEFKQSTAVAGVGTMHGFDEANVIHALSEFGEEVADPGTGLAVLLEGPRGLEEIKGFPGDDLGAGEGQGLAVVALEQGLIVEGVDLGRAAVHEQEDDTLGTGGEVGLLDGEGVESGEGERREANRGDAEEVAAAESAIEMSVPVGVHGFS